MRRLQHHPSRPQPSPPPIEQDASRTSVEMAHLNVKPDPAYLKLQALNKSRHHYFRWTPRTARITFMYVVVVPAIFGWVAYKTDGLWDLRAKRKGDTVWER